jgi:holo-[acyl-carrier protein] synthase
MLGIGTDIVDSRRIQKAIDKFQKRFLDKLFSKKEQKRCDDFLHPFERYAKIYAAKEAAFKAIENVQGLGMLDIEISHEKSGKPILFFHEKAQKKILKKSDNIIKLNLSLKSDLSISDEPPYVVAFVILYAC